MIDSGIEFLIMKTLILAVTSILALCSAVAAQGSPSGSRPVKPAAGQTSSLKDDSTRPEVEPALGRFRLNIKFARARASQPTGPEGSKVWAYRWEYPEATLLLKFFKVASGTFPNDQAERLAVATKLLDGTIRDDIKGEKVSEKDIRIGSDTGREARLLIKGNPAVTRSLIRDDIWYLTLAIPKKAGNDGLIDRVLASFEFVK